MVIVYDRTNGANPASSQLRIETLPAGSDAGSLAGHLHPSVNSTGPLRVLVRCLHHASQ